MLLSENDQWQSLVESTDQILMTAHGDQVRNENLDLPCTFFFHLVLKCFTIGQHECHFELPKHQFCWPSDGF